MSEVTMPIDGNSKPVPVLRPGTGVNVTDTTSAATTSDVVRLCSVAGCQYAIGAAGTVELPAGAIEYIKVTIGETITVVDTCNITQMS
jgi:hypothetical protein